MQEAAGTDMPTRILARTLEMPASTGLRSPMTSHCMRQIGDTLALIVMRTGWGLRSDGHHIQCIAHFQDMHEHHADDGHGLHELDFRNPVCTRRLFPCCFHHTPCEIPCP